MIILQSRRDATQKLKVNTDTHAGLWLDKYLKLDDPDPELKPQAKLVKGIAKDIRTPDIYKDYFDRWKQGLKQTGAICREARVLGRLAINLGAEAVLETSIALHRTYGVPYIPGSALKGLAAHYARNHLENEAWQKKGEAYQIMFGTTKTGGYVTFFDALYVPETGHKGKALWPDIITVHHPDYYQGKKDAPPADWDSPTPIPFLSATGNFLIALAGPDKWVEKAFEILDLGLKEEGIGAKTSSGYGRMSFGNFIKNMSSPSQMPKLTNETEVVEKPLVWRKGTVREFKPQPGFGRLTDDETGQEYRFDRKALPPGYDPGKKHKIEYALREGDDRVVQIKKSF
ncbi:MAG: type III-B CRISPR module RAMP protein Cmr6 [Anaerolineales bacterium]|nr:type III-B CRISPR module RAMP protein Cmr6 [Anaerolineales bacterium]